MYFNDDRETYEDKVAYEVESEEWLDDYKEQYCDGIDCAWCCDAECRRWKHE